VVLPSSWCRSVDLDCPEVLVELLHRTVVSHQLVTGENGTVRRRDILNTNNCSCLKIYVCCIFRKVFDHRPQGSITVIMGPTTWNTKGSQMSPVNAWTQYFLKIAFNIILSSKFAQSSFPFKSSKQNFVCISHVYHACYMSHASYPSWFDHPNNIWSCTRYEFHRVIFSILVLLYICEVQVLSSAPVLRHPQYMLFR
jgi:hypothetical protein